MSGESGESGEGRIGEMYHLYSEWMLVSCLRYW